MKLQCPYKYFIFLLSQLLLLVSITKAYKFGWFRISRKGGNGATTSPPIPGLGEPAPFIVRPLRSTIAKPGVRSHRIDKEFEKNLKLGVLFLNLGGPERVEDVEGFLYNLFKDPDIIRLPPALSVFQKPLAYAIAKRRAPKSSAAYESIGGGSPIVKYTREQSELVQDALRRRGFEEARCYFAMRYWHPYTEETLEQLQADGVNTLVVVPLYPQFSISTSGSSLKLLQDIFYREPQRWGPQQVAHTVVPAWYHRPGYVGVMARLILEQLQQYSAQEMQEGLHVLFSAHGVPESYIAAGDPYKRQIEECVRLVSAEVARVLASDALRPDTIDRQTGLQLAGQISAGAPTQNIIQNLSNQPRETSSVDSSSVLSMAQQMFDSPPKTASSVPSNSNDHDLSTSRAETGTEILRDTAGARAVEFHLSFQSRVGPVKWLQPYTEQKLQELGEQRGVQNLVVVPVSFVSEHIETLEEIDMEYRELAQQFGICNWRRVPALNTDQGFIEDMADLVVEALEAPTLTVAEAASSSYSDMIDGGGSGGMSSSGSGSGIDSLGSSSSTADKNSSLASAAARRLRGVVAMASVVSTSAIELLNHHPMLQMLGFK